MSWLFGRKKHQKDSPPDSTEEEHASDQHGEFVITQLTPTPSSMVQDTVIYPRDNLYPYIPSISDYGKPFASDSSKDANQGESTHYLTGVPFKMCKRLENSMSDDLEIDKLRISEILSFIERIGSQNYDYSFSVEKGIIAEMNSTSDE